MVCTLRREPSLTGTISRQYPGDWQCQEGARNSHRRRSASVRAGSISSAEPVSDSSTTSLHSDRPSTGFKSLRSYKHTIQTMFDVHRHGKMQHKFNCYNCGCTDTVNHTMHTQSTMAKPSCLRGNWSVSDPRSWTYSLMRIHNSAVHGYLLMMIVCSLLWTSCSANTFEREASMPMAGNHQHKNKSKTLYIGGIFPMEGAWAGGRGCRPAVDMALEDVNRREDILPEFKLEMVAHNSKCMPGLGMNVLYELLYNKPTKMMLLGPGCSPVSTFVGQAARMWNLVVLSYGSSSPALSNRERFPSFFRTHPSATLHNPTRVKLFKKLGWTRIATIQETEEVFTSTIEDLEKRVKKEKIEIAVRTSFLGDPKNAVRNLKRQDARIIVGVFYEDKARRVFCEVYKQKLYGPKYVWFIIGWYPDNWYRKEDKSINCTADQLKEALEGSFTTEGLMFNLDNSRTISGMTSEEFRKKVQDRIYKADPDSSVNPLSVTGYVEAPLAYDAVWALALALNKTQDRLKKKNSSLEEFDYENTEIMEEIYAAMNATDFTGVSGRVAFNSKGDRIAWTRIERMWDGNYSICGFYDYASDNLTCYNDPSQERWLGDKRPQDRTELEIEQRMVSAGLFITMSFLASQGIIVAMVLVGFNYRLRHMRYIKLSQPGINITMLLGCMLCLSCVFLEGLDHRYLRDNNLAFELICQLRTWALCLGFTLAYGPMFSKVWTIYRITTGRKKEIKPMKDWEMYTVVAILLFLDCIIMTSWQVIDPLRMDVETFPREKPRDAERDIEIEPQLKHCSCQHVNVWLGVTFGYKGVLLLFGILLAYETRNIKVKQINDSKFVGMSIYNVVVLCFITAPVSLIIGSHQDARFAFIAVAILLSSCLAMGLIFVPKIMEVVRNPQEGMESAALTDSTVSREEEERHNRLMAENEDLKKQIAEKEDKLKELNRRLQLKSQQRTRAGSLSDPPEVANGPKTIPVVGISPPLTASSGLNGQLSLTAPTVTFHAMPNSNVMPVMSNNSVSFNTQQQQQVPNSKDQQLLTTMPVDREIDSALPTCSTTKSSKTSAVSDEPYSESYC